MAVSIPVISLNDVTVTEGNSGTSFATFTVSLDKAAGPGGVTFSYHTSSGTAEEGVDFTSATASNIVIAEGEASRTISVAVRGMIRSTDLIGAILCSAMSAMTSCGAVTATIRFLAARTTICLAGMRAATGYQVTLEAMR